MIAELAACNAAYATIKAALQNGSELSSVAQQIGSFITNQDNLRRKVDKKKRSAFDQGDDFAEFIALETVKQREEEIKQYMIYCGRAGLWNDWLKFSAQARKDRQAAEEARKKQREKLIETIVLSIAIIVGLGVAAVLIYAALKARSVI